MPTTKNISAQIKVKTNQTETFKAVTDWASQKKWIFATRVSGVGSNSNKVGGELEAFTGFGSVGFLDTMTITKWNPPELCEVLHTGKIVKGSGIFEVSSAGGNTYFTWTESVELPLGFIGKIGWMLVGPFVKLGMVVSLRRFKKLLLVQNN